MEKLEELIRRKRRLTGSKRSSLCPKSLIIGKKKGTFRKEIHKQKEDAAPGYIF